MNNKVRLKTLDELHADGIETHINSNGSIVFNTATRSNIILPRQYNDLIESTSDCIREGKEPISIDSSNTIVSKCPELTVSIRSDHLNLI